MQIRRLNLTAFGNTQSMKRTTFILSLIFAAMALTMIFSSCNAKDAQLETLASNCIRIHIRANSNGEEDQAIKLKVRDAVTTYLTTLLEGCKTKQDAFLLLDKNKENLVEIANSTLKQSNFAYKSRVRLTNEYFPDREYDGYVFPAGNYDALIIELGSGKGDNWWCVAFPPLCFVPSGNGGEKVVYKSWIKETLDKLFGKK